MNRITRGEEVTKNTVKVLNFPREEVAIKRVALRWYNDIPEGNANLGTVFPAEQQFIYMSLRRLEAAFWPLPIL